MTAHGIPADVCPVWNLAGARPSPFQLELRVQAACSAFMAAFGFAATIFSKARAGPAG